MVTKCPANRPIKLSSDRFNMLKEACETNVLQQNSINIVTDDEYIYRNVYCLICHGANITQNLKTRNYKGKIKVDFSIPELVVECSTKDTRNKNCTNLYKGTVKDQTGAVYRNLECASRNERKKQILQPKCNGKEIASTCEKMCTAQGKNLTCLIKNR